MAIFVVRVGGWWDGGPEGDVAGDQRAVACTRLVRLASAICISPCQGVELVSSGW